MIFKSHVISLILYSALVALVLALIRRNEKREQIKYFIALFLIMVVGAFLFGWFMYIFIR